MRGVLPGALLGVIAVWTAGAQTPVPAADLPDAAAAFQGAAGPGLRCALEPAAPEMDFAFRFQAGYTYQLPASQFERSATWTVLTRITPQAAPEPVYLIKTSDSSQVKEAADRIEIEGTYLLGVGDYAADSVLTDNSGRTCRQHWRIHAATGHGQHEIAMSLPPGAVRPVPGFAASDWQRPAGGALTVIVNAAPLQPNHAHIDLDDRDTLICELAAVVGRTPASSVRVIVVSLANRKQIFRADHFSIDDMDQVSKAIDAVDLATVNYQALQDPLGHVKFLAQVINQELSAPAPPATLLILGPISQLGGKPPVGMFNPPAATRCFYVQEWAFPIQPRFGGESGPGGGRGGRRGAIGGGPMASPPGGGISTDRSDPIAAIMSALKGRTWPVSSPAELAKFLHFLQEGK